MYMFDGFDSHVEYVVDVVRVSERGLHAVIDADRYILFRHFRHSLILCNGSSQAWP